MPYTARIWLLAAALLAAGCATRAPLLPPETPATPAQLELADTPFIPQQRYQCGPAALAMLLQQSGVAVDADALVPQIYLPQRKGSLQIEILAASRRHNRIPYPIDPTLAGLVQALRSGRPVLVLQNLGLASMPLWHYAVVIGYERNRDVLILRSGTDARQRMPARLFLRTWHAGENWGLVMLRPGELPAFAGRQRYLGAVAAMEGIATPDALADAYRVALERWPGDTTALFGLANTRYAQQRFEEALRSYRTILAAQPDHIAALNNLAMLYADMGCHDRADALIRRALTLAGNDHPLRGALLNTRQRVQQQTGAAAARCEAVD